MAQVTMDSKEYLELIYKAKAWDEHQAAMLENFTVRTGNDYYNNYHIGYDEVFPKAVLQSMAKQVVETVVACPEAMKFMHQNHETVFDARRMTVSRRWDDNLALWQVDLMKYPEFKKAFEAYDNEEEE